MALEVHRDAGCWKSGSVLYGLEIKKLDYRTKGPAPQGKVKEGPGAESLGAWHRRRSPLLKDRDFSVSGSLAILRYLDQVFPRVPFFGRTPRNSALVNQMVHEMSEHLSPAFDLVITSMTSWMGKTDQGMGLVRGAIGTIQDEFTFYEARLAKSPWLMGSFISAADILLAPIVHLIGHLNRNDLGNPLHFAFSPLKLRYPSISSWLKAMDELSSMEKAHPELWDSIPVPHVTDHPPSPPNSDRI